MQVQNNSDGHSVTQQTLNQNGLLQQIASYFRSQKQLLTYRIHVDLTSIDETLQSLKNQSPQQATKLEQEKTRLLQNYLTAIKKYDDICAKAQLQQVQKMILDNNQQALNEQKQFTQLLMPELQTIEGNLNQEFIKVLADIKIYLETLADRIKHQKYLNDQQRIGKYIERQRNCVNEKKQAITKIIQKRNQQIREMVKVAKGVCTQKQTHIRTLEQSNLTNQQTLKQTLRSIQQMDLREKQMYSQVSMISQQILELKGQKKRKPVEMVSNQIKQEGSQVFTNKNLGSEIRGSGSQIKEKSSAVFFASQLQSKPPIKCEIEGGGFVSELYEKKLPVLGLFILSVLLAMW